MKRGWFNYFLDLALGLNALFMGTSGLIMWLVLPCKDGVRGFKGGRVILEAVRQNSEGDFPLQ